MLLFMCVCEFCAHSQVLRFISAGLLQPAPIRKKQPYRSTVKAAYQDPYLGFLLGSKGGSQAKYK